MAKDYEELVRKFEKGATGGSRRKMLIQKDAMFSFKTHFTLAVRGNFGHGIRYVLNSDQRSSSTSNHQAHVKVLRPHIVLPFRQMHHKTIADAPVMSQFDLGIKEIHSLRHPRDYYVCPSCYRIVRGIEEYADPVHSHDNSPICPGPNGLWQCLHVWESVRVFFETFDGKLYIYAPVKRTGRKYIVETCEFFDVSDDKVLTDFLRKRPGLFDNAPTDLMKVVETRLSV